MSDIKTIGEALASVSDKIDLEITQTSKAKEEAAKKFSDFRKTMDQVLTDLVKYVQASHKEFARQFDSFEQSTFDEYETRMAALIEVANGPSNVVE